jgi:hypothetical protein
MAERVRATCTAPRHPLADRALAHPQCCGDLTLRPPLLLEGPGLEPSGFFPIVGCMVHTWQSSPNTAEL